MGVSGPRRRTMETLRPRLYQSPYYEHDGTLPKALRTPQAHRFGKIAPRDLRKSNQGFVKLWKDTFQSDTNKKLYSAARTQVHAMSSGQNAQRHADAQKIFEDVVLRPHGLDDLRKVEDCCSLEGLRRLKESYLIPGVKWEDLGPTRDHLRRVCRARS